eukprot:TRINITY_DN2143_c0_g1_i1.p1 TRINITY_DN2143_c0_g1~~TRINITY_DN2143_c0_g1_i1.p1  ORF type:complete len:358 (-),score=99.97 TRINITY_DN2143_c0_g1_i1:202-1275(-)
MPPSKNISFDELSKYFHLPINQVAKELGVCATILKKICRRNGIPRWPHRKIKSLDKMIGNLEVNLAKNPQEKDDITREIDTLKSKRTEILNNPDILSKSHHNNNLNENLRPHGVKMNRTKNSLGHRGKKDQNSDEEPNCFVSQSDGRFLLTHNGTSYNSLANLGFTVQQPQPQQQQPSYVDMVFSAHSGPFPTPVNGTPANNFNKPQIINALANMKFDMNAPVRKNPSMDLSSYSYEAALPMKANVTGNITPYIMPQYSPYGDQFALPSLRLLDASRGQQSLFANHFAKEEVGATPSIPYLDTTALNFGAGSVSSFGSSSNLNLSQQAQQFNLSASNSSSNLPSWFDEEKSRYLKRT